MTKQEYREQNVDYLTRELKKLDKDEWLNILHNSMLNAASPQIPSYYEVEYSKKKLADALETLSKFPTNESFCDWLKERFYSKDDLINHIVDEYTSCDMYNCILERDVEDCFSSSNIWRAINTIVSIWLSNRIKQFLRRQSVLLWNFKTFNPFVHTCEQ